MSSNYWKYILTIDKANLVYIGECKPHLINWFCEIELSLNLLLTVTKSL